MGTTGIGSFVTIDDIINQYSYIDFLRENMRHCAEKLGLTQTYKFYQDNDLKHSSLNTRLWLLYNYPYVIKYPVQSPVLNPIEDLWGHLENRLRKRELSSKIMMKY
ncbi:transposable element Tcb1 transposase [Nephila pilipes]|uniref:Transposable element Tcb1 transposase n=1 Tax=Nephila pilipes TaxID=299642 RepID=A0A8X6NIM4_NEPPI|nr:transposable element Tcb1 transposase [Nephila pilipes]